MLLSLLRGLKNLLGVGLHLLLLGLLLESLTVAIQQWISASFQIAQIAALHFLGGAQA